MLARDAVAPGSPGLAAVVERFGRASSMRRAASTGARLADSRLPRRRRQTGSRSGSSTRRCGGPSTLVRDPRSRQASVRDRRHPLLYETGREVDFDVVIVTACDPATQIRRIVERDSLTEAEAQQRIDAQLPLAEKIARADYVIRTDGRMKTPRRRSVGSMNARCWRGWVALGCSSGLAGWLSGRDLHAGARRAQRVLHQHRDRQRADAAGNRRERTGHLRHLRMHVTDENGALRLEQLRRRWPAGNRLAATAASVTRLIATSMTTAPGLTNSRRHQPRLADGCHEDVGAGGTSPRGSGVREWQMVTVASRCSSSIAIGLPTMSLRPMTTACRPEIGIVSRSSSSMMPAGVHATSFGRFCTSSPTLSAPKPSTSFSAAIVSNTRCCAPAPIALGSGDCTRMPSWHGAAVQPLDERQHVGERRGRGQPLEVDAETRPRFQP